MSFFVVDEVKRAAAGQGCGLIITQDNIPLIINKPGKYSLAEDITNITGTAITVAANEVCLDLNCRTVRGGFIGIEVRPDIQNVTIQNGHVLSTASTGILIDPRCSAITVDNITANSHGLIGIEVQQNSQDIALLNSHFDYNRSMGIVFRAGCQSLLVDNSSGDNNGPTGSFSNSFGLLRVAGLLVDGRSTSSVFDVTVRNSSFSGMFSSSPLTVFGCIIRDTDRVSIHNCVSRNVVSMGADLGGIVVADVSGDVDINGCISEGNLALTTVQGLIVTNATNRISIRNTIVRNMRSLSPSVGTGAFGILALANTGLGTDVTINNCVVQGIYGSQNSASPTRTSARGFSIFGGDTALVEDCVAEDISGPCNNADGFAANNTKSVIFRNCEAIKITNTATILTFTMQASGFDSGLANASGSGNILATAIFENCIADNVTFAVSPNRACGFMAQNSVGTSFIDCVSRGASQGFRLDVPEVQVGDPVNCFVEGSIAYNNALAGFVDTTPTATANVFLRNIAYNNGINYTRNLVTFGLSADTPIRTWSHSLGLPPEVVNNLGQTPDTFDSLSIV